MKWLSCWFLLAGLFVSGFCHAQSKPSVTDQILPLLTEQLLAANAQETQPETNSLDSDAVLVTQEMTAHRTSPDGKPSDATFVITTVWRKLPVGWRVTYCHESWAR